MKIRIQIFKTIVCNYTYFHLLLSKSEIGLGIYRFLKFLPQHRCYLDANKNSFFQSIEVNSFFFFYNLDISKFIYF